MQTSISSRGRNQCSQLPKRERKSQLRRQTGVGCRQKNLLVVYLSSNPNSKQSSRTKRHGQTTTLVLIRLEQNFSSVRRRSSMSQIERGSITRRCWPIKRARLLVATTKRDR